MTIALTHAKSATAAAARDTSSDGGASDEALIKRIAGGDQLAMRTLYARHRIPLYRWLLRIVRNETVAEDLLSEVFLDVWRQAASLTMPGQPKRLAGEVACPFARFRSETSPAETPLREAETDMR